MDLKKKQKKELVEERKQIEKIKTRSIPIVGN